MSDANALRERIADELTRHCDTVVWSSNDAEPVTVTLGCRCGHERAVVTAEEWASDLAGYLRQHRLHVADALLKRMTLDDRAEIHYAGMQAVRDMPSDWYCPRSPDRRQRRDCPECVAEVALDAALAVLYNDEQA